MVPVALVVCGFEQLALELARPALVVAEDPFVLLGRSVDFDDGVLVAERNDDAVVTGIIGDAVAMGPIQVFRKSPVVPIDFHQVITPPEDVEMIERVPAPDDFAVRGKLDNIVAHHRLGGARRGWVGFAGVVVVDLPRIGGPRRDLRPFRAVGGKRRRPVGKIDG